MAAVAVLVFLPHYAARSTVYDSRWCVHRALSLMHTGDLDLSEYEHLMGEQLHYTLERRDGCIYSTFPIGTPVLVAPLVAALDGAYAVLGDESLSARMVRDLDHVGGVQRFIASILTAISSVLVYWLARRWGYGRAVTLSAVAIFAFCTPMWSTASRALWQHGPGVLMLLVALCLVTAAERRPWLAQSAALPLTMAYVIRPTYSLAAAALSIYVLVRFRRVFLAYAAWGLALTAVFALYGFSVYGTPLPPYYQPGRLGGGPVLEALAGHLVSPARGLLVYSPIVVLAVVGVAVARRRGRVGLLRWLLVALLVAHWLAISSFAHWWGGYSYGPRFWTDMSPVLVLLSLPALAWLVARAAKGRWALPAAGLLLAGWSFFTHAHGAYDAEAMRWNATPVDVDRHPRRLWDWSDPQFLRF